MVFCPCLFKDITLCKSFVICLVCSVTFQKLRLYEYSGKLRYSDSDFLLCIFVVCCMSGEFEIDLLVLDTVHCTRLLLLHKFFFYVAMLTLKLML